MSLDLTKIEDVMKAIKVETIELSPPPPGAGEGENGDQEGDQQGKQEGQGQEGDGQDQEQGDTEGEGEGEGDGEQEEEIPLVAEEDAGTFYVVRVWITGNLNHSRPDRTYLVEAEYPAQATEAAQEDAQKDLGPELDLWAVYRAKEQS